MLYTRKEFMGSILATGLFVSFPSMIFSQKKFPATDLKHLIRLAGNASNDKDRVLLLEKALNMDISQEEKDIIKSIHFMADNWANGFEKYARPGTEGNEPEGYLCGFFIRCSLQNYLLPRIPEDHILFPMIAFYRSRMLIAKLIQSGNIINVPDVRDNYLKESERLMKIASAAFPENELAKNYLGKYSPWEEIVPYNSKAPAWANYQRMILEKLSWLIHWWINNRQISDGQFGGGWGDDVEMWRSWVPVLLAFDDEKAKKSKEKLFEGLFKLSRMQKGYTTIMTDVEHTSEEYSDPLFCMLNMQAENPVWEQRTLKVMDFIENLWAGINDRGQLQFKSTWFNVDRAHTDERWACDTPYHTRLLLPLLLLWLRNGNKRIENFIIPWIKTWVEATFTSECGKPEGIIPAAIHWPDGRPAGLGKNWWQPENHTEPTLYYFPAQQSMMYECFLLAYHMTKDEYFLKPIRFIAEKRLQKTGDNAPENYQPGSLEWSVSILKNQIPKILIKYRLITGDNSYDSIFKKDSRSYERFIMEHNIKKLSNKIKEQQKSLSLPREFYTTEVRWTDRLFSFIRYFNFKLEEKLPYFDAGFLFSCLTGSIGNHMILPVFGVKWITPSTNIAILTTINSKDTFKAQLFHFGTEPRKMKAKFLNLNHGKYIWRLNGNKKNVFELSQDNNEIAFVLPPGKLCKLTVKKFSTDTNL